MTYEQRLGRLHAPDNRDSRYPMRSLLPVVSDRRYRSWYGSRWHLDQGSTPRCVEYAWKHFLVDSPRTHRMDGEALHIGGGSYQPGGLYDLFQRADEWPGEDYDGTSVRAGAKVLQGLQLILEYRWAATLTDLVICLLEQGPVIVGTDWYEGMFSPVADQLSPATLKVEGEVVGGHAYKIDGINRPAKRLRVKNSWGRDWGRDGYAWLSFNDAQRLIFDGNGEAVVAVEA